MNAPVLGAFFFGGVFSRNRRNYVTFGGLDMEKCMVNVGPGPSLFGAKMPWLGFKAGEIQG